MPQETQPQYSLCLSTETQQLSAELPHTWSSVMGVKHYVHWLLLSDKSSLYQFPDSCGFVFVTFDTNSNI